MVANGNIKNHKKLLFAYGICTVINTDFFCTAVQTGKVDMGLAGMTVTDERKKSVNFSDTYATGIQVVIVKEGGKISSIDDLDPYYVDD